MSFPSVTSEATEIPPTSPNPIRDNSEVTQIASAFNKKTRLTESCCYSQDGAKLEPKAQRKIQKLESPLTLDLNQQSDPNLVELFSGKGLDIARKIVAQRTKMGLESCSVPLFNHQQKKCIAALVQISRRYKLSTEEQSVFRSLTDEVQTIKDIDSFVVFAYKFSLITTFIHQKYYTGNWRPANYVGVKFRPEASCTDIYSLPYEKLLSEPGDEYSKSSTSFRFALIQHLNDECVSKSLLKDSHLILKLLKGECSHALYPEFDIAEKRDLLRLIHLGIHVLALTAEPWFEADGRSYAPILALMHDVVHTHNIDVAKRVKVNKKSITDSEVREQEIVYGEACQLLLDELEAKGHPLYSAMVDVLFSMIHEAPHFYTELVRDMEPQNKLFFHVSLGPDPFNDIRSKSHMSAFIWLSTWFNTLKVHDPKGTSQEKLSELLVKQTDCFSPDEALVDKLFGWRQLELTTSSDTLEKLLGKALEETTPYMFMPKYNRTPHRIKYLLKQYIGNILTIESNHEAFHQYLSEGFKDGTLNAAFFHRDFSRLYPDIFTVVDS